MTFKKNFPPEFAQCVFKKNNAVAQINGLDYDLILWLNYHCSYEWDKNKSLTSLFLYTDIKRDFKKTLNTNSIQASLKRIDAMEFEMNYLKSYGSKTRQSYTPFAVKKLIDAASEKSYGFEVTVDKTYISLFTNPSPKVTLEYCNTTVLTQSTYKKLYLLLRDALGKNTSNARIIDIDDLRNLLNIAGVSISNTKLVNTIKKAIKVITDNTNLQVTLIVQKKLTKNGSKEIDKIRFRLYKQAIPQTTHVATQIIQATPLPPAVATPPTTPIAQTSTSNTSSQPVTVTQSDEEEIEETEEEREAETDRLFEAFVDRKVDLIASKRNDINDIDKFKVGVKNKLMDDHQETIHEFNIVDELNYYKNELMDDLPKGSNNSMIALTDPDDDTIRYIINEKYKVTDMHSTVKVDKVADVLDFFDERYMEGYYWKIMNCSNTIKYKLMVF